eukprot:CAMPEP_0179241492 /NCGR_PEP_ID=MMETSP0797-20121207/16525_1 /TAXON_ID=47934 /ORGANISM="Dinophysis acuminata, Strain DAEP01" /LENGTH=90 /DNA_ID=CAMNT_0020948889 /DNA_START=65 /DNA_END=334 /DNA_ORIENTATION=-
MTGAHHEHGAGPAADDTSTVVMGGFFGGLAGLVLQVMGYGGIPETAAVAGATASRASSAASAPSSCASSSAPTSRSRSRAERAERAGGGR